MTPLFDMPHKDMETLDEQLDAANAKVAELNGQVAGLQTALEQARTDKEMLETANSELADNLKAAKETAASQEQRLREALAEVDRLKAEAKTAEERAAEIYGAQAGQPVAVTAKGNPPEVSVSERFKAITDPAGQTAFLRSLSDSERAELFSNI